MALIDDSSSRAERGTDKRLDSWKAIAAHLGRDVRTVQRWEKDERLPIHRLKHETRATVFAWTGELDRWIAARSESPPSRSRRLRYWVAGLAAAVLLAAGLAISKRPPRQVQPLDVRPLTSEIGLFWAPRLSPDGERLVYVHRTSGSADLILRKIADGEESPLHQTAANEYSPAWSPDGSAIAFLRETSSGVSDLIVLSLGDRIERRIARVAAPPFGAPHLIPPHLDWSPGGSFLVVPERTG